MKYYLAQTYGSGGYNQNRYTDGSTNTGESTAVTSSAAAADNTTLANTGVYVIAVVALACFLIFLALIIRFARRKTKDEALSE